MIKHWMITGDTHRNFSRFKNYGEEYNNEETGIIILGDAGFNIDNSIQDAQIKNKITKTYNFYIYCVRGNHELRPEDLDMIVEYDSNVGGYILYQKRWPTIRYFQDYAEYTIDGYKTLVLGGAYSVDKKWRLQNCSFWNPTEQLSEAEMKEAYRVFGNKKYDLILSHTCPYQYMPEDLFLGFINQNEVDKSMERWMNNFIGHTNVWLYGHYHADRIERPGVEIFFEKTEDLKNIMNRWKRYYKTGELDWWLPKSPNFYMGE